MADIRHFFDDIDLEHMHRRGLDLSTYETLKSRSTDVYFQTRPPTANMPPESERKWSYERSRSFENWIRDGHPFGDPRPVPPQSGSTARVRKDADALDTDELDQLRRAFEGIMNREPSDPASYFSLASLHWYPTPFHCKHHEDRYNPWHRAYLIEFEDALRTVEGCEQVTLPYWDITKPPPPFLFDEPFRDFELPVDIHEEYPAGYTTIRDSPEDIATNVQREGIPGNIREAMARPVWSDFASYVGGGIEAAHDAGHPACGVTLSVPDAAAFDPLFWFFHANWDRLWWEWQQAMRATTLWSFRSTITGSTAFLEPPLNGLSPFTRTTDALIDLTALRIGYTLSTAAEEDATPTLERARFGSRRVGTGLRVAREPLASVRLKGVNRLAIPGSFRAVLRAGERELARRTFFQPTVPAECANCRRNSHVDLTFTAPIDDVLDTELKVDVELVVPDPSIGSRMSLQAVGDPSLNVRLLLNDPE